MNKLSVAIITFNEEHHIGRCIDSVLPVADEVIVLDSHSTDNTCAIAVAKGARVVQQTFAGYIEQKNDALALAQYDLVLSLDADEALDDRLQQSILTAKKNNPAAGYTMNRCTYYCGRFIRHGAWYPDRKLRLFNKQLAKWGGTNPHDKVEFDSRQPTTHLAGDILHYSYYSLEEHITQNNKFSTISAESYFKRGKKTSLFKIIFNPCWAFFSGFILRGGFLDGFYGYVIARNVAHLTFLKHSKLYLMQRKAAADKKGG
jgi:glycosyltransferase involved in cell wall biosynthesis